MNDLKNLILSLSGANGTPGEENEISELIEKYVSRFASTSRDRFSNLTAELPGSSKTILLDAHTDRIGMIVTSVEDGGFLRVAKCGGMDARVLAAQDVTEWLLQLRRICQLLRTRKKPRTLTRFLLTRE